VVPCIFIIDNISVSIDIHYFIDENGCILYVLTFKYQFFIELKLTDYK
jgi:hypothetical protein